MWPDLPGAGPLVAAATRSPKDVNQDAAAVVRAAGLVGVVVADGIGTHHGAAEASRFVVETLGAGLTATTQLPDLYAETHRRLRAHVDALPTPPPDPERAYGTTALCACEREGWIDLAYVGNGAILHLRGNFDAIPDSQLLPWNALNYLNPHAVSRRGRNPLYRFLAPYAPEAAAVPTLLRLAKDTVGVGDIVVVCTDGVHSFDQTPIGLDGEDNVWIRGEPALRRLYAALSRFLVEGELTGSGLERALEAYLQELCDAGLLSDDATVAVLITDVALLHHAGRRAPAKVER